MNSGFMTLLIVTYLAWNTNSISELDETLSQVTNDLRGDTNNISAQRGTLYNVVVIMYVMGS